MLCGRIGDLGGVVKLVKLSIQKIMSTENIYAWKSQPFVVSMGGKAVTKVGQKYTTPKTTSSGVFLIEILG